MPQLRQVVLALVVQPQEIEHQVVPEPVRRQRHRLGRQLGQVRFGIVADLQHRRLDGSLRFRGVVVVPLRNLFRASGQGEQKQGAEDTEQGISHRTVLRHRVVFPPIP